MDKNPCGSHANQNSLISTLYHIRSTKLIGIFKIVSVLDCNILHLGKQLKNFVRLQTIKIPFSLLLSLNECQGKCRTHKKMKYLKSTRITNMNEEHNYR